MQRLSVVVTGIAAALVSGAAAAHVGVHGEGLASGLVHPFAGLDHLLAMVAVGMWAAQIGGRARIALPAAFVLFMAAGAAAGAWGFALPHVEGMIAASVLLLGAVIALAARLGWRAALPAVGVFAIFHGHAHGAEMPALAAPALYFAGFLLATALLHAAGVAAGFALRTRPALLRSGGAAIGLAGCWLAVSLL